MKPSTEKLVQCLFIDDEEWKHWMLSRNLEKLAVSMKHVRTSGQAIDALQAYPFDIVFLDMILFPNRPLRDSSNGMAIVDRIVEMETPPSLVVLTAVDPIPNAWAKAALDEAKVAWTRIPFQLVRPH